MCSRVKSKIFPSEIEKYKLAENGNIQVKYKYVKIVLKCSTWVKVLYFYFPPLWILPHTVW